MQLERLEQRRLLAMTALGPATDVAGQGSRDFDLAVAGDGSFMVARVTGPFDAVERHVEVVRYSVTGEQMGEIIGLADGDASMTGVAIAMDADGDAVVTWADDGIYVARISRAGVATAPVSVVSGSGFSPAVSMDDGGGYFLAWTAQNTPENSVELRVRAFDKDGDARSAAFTALHVSLPSGSIGNIDIDAESDGGGAVVVAAETFESATDNVAFARVNVAGLVEAGDITAGTLNEGDPVVAVNADGSFEIGYTIYEKVGGSGGDPVGLSIVVQRFDAAGDTLGNPITLWPASNAAVPRDILHTPVGVVSLDTAAGGGFIASWARTINTGTGSEFSPTFLQRFDAFGVADNDGPLPLVSDSGLNRIGFDANGQAVVAYLPGQESAPLRFMRVAVGQDYAFIERDDFLHVVGTGVDDVISITLSGTHYVVSRAGARELSFSRSSVHVLLIDGLDGDDTITNDTDLIATLRGGDGADTVFGGSGTDRIHGGPGNDSLWGQGGTDRIYGEDGVDSLYGNGGNDRLEGGANSDHMRGNGGRDTMYGNGGNDRMYGGASGDRIYGQAGNDQILGEGGNDRLYGDDGYADTLTGGAGDDVFITLDDVRDDVFGDGGYDTANADAVDVLTSIITS